MALPATKLSSNRIEALKAERSSLLINLIENHTLHRISLIVLTVALLAAGLLTQIQMAGGIGFAMDDSWIHVTVARNFAHGLGWGVIPNQTLSVSTSPTWTLLLSTFFYFFENPLKIAFICSLACQCIAALFFYELASLLTGRRLLGLFAAVLILLDPIALWGLSSGLELPLALASLAAVLWSYYAFDPQSIQRTYLVPALLGFAGVTRPELFILTPLALADTFLSLRSGATSYNLRKALIVILKQALIVGLVLSPYFAFNLYSHGRIFPATYYAKTIVRGVGLSAALVSGSWASIKQSILYNPLSQVFAIIDTLQKNNVLVLLLISPAILAFSRPFATKAGNRGYLLPLSLLMLPWVMGMSSPSKFMSNHADRYFVIFPPLAILMAVTSLRLILDFPHLKKLALTLMGLMLLWTWRTTPPALRHVGIDAESTQRLYVDMPIWLNENLSPTAKLAVNDIGGIGYYAPRELIDVMGLATPEVWPAIQREFGKPMDISRLRDFLRAKGIEYIILSPRYYPELTKDRSTFEPLHEWREKYEHGRTISPQILYKVNWH